MADRALDVYSAALTTSIPVVYPKKDGYRDSVQMTATALTFPGVKSAPIGKIVITRGGKAVASWTISAARPATVTWNGLVKSQVSSGAYSVGVSYQNPDGTTTSATTSIVVSAKKLVQHSWQHTVSAFSALWRCSDVGFVCEERIGVNGYWVKVNGKVVFKPTTPNNGINYVANAAPYYSTSSYASERVSLPSAITNSISARMKVSASVELSGPSGKQFQLAVCPNADSDLDLWDCAPAKTVSRSGVVTSSLVSLEPGSSAASWDVTASPNSNALVWQYTVTVVYTVLE